MSIKVSFVSLGCSKNQIDAEIMLHTLKEAGFELCSLDKLGDVVVVNTCGFINSAKAEAIEEIIELGKLKDEGRIKGIVVTGCLAERYKDEILSDMNEVNVVLGLGSNCDIVKAVTKAYEGEKFSSYGAKETLDIDGDRLLTTLPFYAYIKVAEGCDNRCTYCAIPSIRGKFRSRKAENIIAEAKKLAEGGVKEIILVAQDTTKYGLDLYGEYYLPKLLKELVKIEGIEWIRLLYCYPDKITDELIECIKENSKIARYLDIPIQHCSDNILKAMNRKGNKQEIADMIQKLRANIPNITIRTTLIAGFPGETDEDFTELCEFVKETKFDHLGCFAFSAEEGTPAFTMEPQIDEDEKNNRANLVMETQYDIATKLNEQKIGSKIKVMVEGFDKIAECYFGRSEYDAPEIDGKVFFTIENMGNANAKSLTMGDFVDVLIEDSLEYDLVGRVVE